MQITIFSKIGKTVLWRLKIYANWRKQKVNMQSSFGYMHAHTRYSLPKTGWFNILLQWPNINYFHVLSKYDSNTVQKEWGKLNTFSSMRLENIIKSKWSQKCNNNAKLRPEWTYLFCNLYSSLVLSPQSWLLTNDTHIVFINFII